MDINLILSAQTLGLAPHLRRSELNRGLFVIKNVPAKTYLRVTPEQWLILQKFETPQMVPTVLGDAIRDRQCLPLGEFYELILKALRAKILLEPGAEPAPVSAYGWTWSVRPNVVTRPLVLLFCAGMSMVFYFHPKVPSSLLDVAAGLLILCAALSFGDFVAGCMIRGAGGEVYRPRWRWMAFPPHFAVDKSDAVMLPRSAQTVVGMATPSMLATAAGIASWHEPGWAFFPVLGLMFGLRPILGGRVAAMIQMGKGRSPSDAEDSFIFTPNRRPGARLRLLSRTATQLTTWVRLLYGLIWTVAFLDWVMRLNEIRTLTPAFLQANGLRVAVGIAGSLAVLAAGFLIWEIFHIARDSTRIRRKKWRQWRQRWFGRAAAPDEEGKFKLLATSAVLCALQPADRQELAARMSLQRVGPWKVLYQNSGAPTHVSLIISGRIGVQRRLPSGRFVQVQILSEGDMAGLHDIADPILPDYRMRTLTPVSLLTMERATAVELVVRRVPQALLAEMLLKLPFLREIPLCRNWHLQAIKRFAQLSSISAFERGSVILSEGQAVEEFFVIFQGDARVSQAKRQLSVIRAGEFFGEIGLMQNSVPNASVTARNGTRCLGISRTELMRFVTHNYTVALELERVSSKRLGRPLFPLKPGDFRGL